MKPGRVCCSSRCSSFLFRRYYAGRMRNVQTMSVCPCFQKRYAWRCQRRTTNSPGGGSCFELRPLSEGRFLPEPGGPFKKGLGRLLQRSNNYTLPGRGCFVKRRREPLRIQVGGADGTCKQRSRCDGGCADLHLIARFLRVLRRHVIRVVRGQQRRDVAYIFDILPGHVVPVGHVQPANG